VDTLTIIITMEHLTKLATVYRLLVALLQALLQASEHQFRHPVWLLESTVQTTSGHRTSTAQGHSDSDVSYPRYARYPNYPIS